MMSQLYSSGDQFRKKMEKAEPGLYYAKPIEFDGTMAEFMASFEFADRPFVWVRPKGGEITKVYRSYSDYVG